MEFVMFHLPKIFYHSVILTVILRKIWNISIRYCCTYLIAEGQGRWTVFSSETIVKIERVDPAVGVGESKHRTNNKCDIKNTFHNEAKIDNLSR